MVSCGCDAASGRLAGECDALVVGNIFCELPRGDFDCGAVIILPEKGNHGTACITGTRVIDDRFDAVADFDSIFAVVGCEEKQNAGTFFFGANAKMLEEIDCEIFHRAVVERFDGDNGHLRGGFLFELGAERFEALFGSLRNDSGEIGDVSGGRNFVDVVAESGRSSEKQNRKGEKDGRTETRHERLEHSPLKPARELLQQQQASRFLNKSASARDGINSRKVSEWKAKHGLISAVYRLRKSNAEETLWRNRPDERR